MAEGSNTKKLKTNLFYAGAVHACQAFYKDKAGRLKQDR